MTKLADDLTLSLKEESRKQVYELIKNPTKSDYQFALKCMLMGAEIALRRELEKEDTKHLRRF